MQNLPGFTIKSDILLHHPVFHYHKNNGVYCMNRISRSLSLCNIIIPSKQSYQMYK
jgi:hypothetical protein